MADPFEVRMRFSAQLEHLNASTMSAWKAAQYALKYKDMDEDLHSCILEQLEKRNMNVRANIMYFIEHLLEYASKERNNDYVRMMQRDIIRVVDAVCPENGSGAANVKVVRKVLQGLKDKSILLEQTVTEIETCLRERDTSANDLSLSSPLHGEEQQHQQPQQQQSTTAKDPDSAAPQAGSANIKPTKRQIEQRIEEDRERHKRMRENMWVVPSDPVSQARKFFAETSDLGEDDLRLGKEETMEYRDAVKGAMCRHKRVVDEKKEVKDERPRPPRPTNGLAQHA